MTVSSHIHGDFDLFRQIWRWRLRQGNVSPFITQAVNGDLRLHDFLWGEIGHRELDSLFLRRRGRGGEWSNRFPGRKGRPMIDAQADRTICAQGVWAEVQDDVLGNDAW